MHHALKIFVWASAVLAVATAGAAEIVSGAGATFPEPLYRRWIEVYAQTNAARVRYDAVGSGQGIRRLLDRAVDFGGTDARLTPEEMESAPGEIFHVPAALGAVAISYNLPGDPVLSLTPDLVADIFLGRIRSWGDARLSGAVGKARLPATEIVVVHRADSSGTTSVLTDYLSKVSSRWRSDVGAGRKVRWPVGMGVDGNPRVADTIRQIPGSIGYVELAHAQALRLPVAHIRNRAGRFVAPTLDAMSAAAVGLTPEDFISITDTPAAEGYPICAFTWLIVYREQNYGGRTRERALELQRWLWWACHEGQVHAGPLGYGALPRPAVEQVEDIIRSMTFEGAPLEGIFMDSGTDPERRP